jgi:hypothetical protein
MTKRSIAEGSIDRSESWKSKVKSNPFGIVGPKEFKEYSGEVRLEDIVTPTREELLVKKEIVPHERYQDKL